MKIHSSLKGLLILIVVFIPIIIFAFFYNGSIDQELKVYGKEGIGQVYDVRYGAKNQTLLFKYTFDGTTYYSGEPINLSQALKKNIGKKYVIYFSKRNPQIVRIYLDREIVD